MIYALPGMGADNGMYSQDWRMLPNSKFLDWPANTRETTIPGLAAQIVADWEIGDGAVIIGSSLGGIVGCEIAKLRKLRRLILVGSAAHKSEVNGLLALLHPLADLAPIEFIQRAAGKLGSDLGSMLSRSDPSFIRTMCRAIFEWEGLAKTVPAPLRIHGRFDRVIPCPQTVDLALDGGHLVTMSHPRECVAFISANQSTDPAA